MGHGKRAVWEPVRLGESHTEHDGCDTIGALCFGCGGGLARRRVFQPAREVRGLHDIKTNDAHDCPDTDNRVGCVCKRGFWGESEPAPSV